MFYVQPHPGLECFCVFPPAVPGVINIKPFQGFVKKNILENIIGVFWTDVQITRTRELQIHNNRKSNFSCPVRGNMFIDYKSK